MFKITKTPAPPTTIQIDITL